MINKGILTQEEMDALLGAGEECSEDRAREMVELKLSVNALELEIAIFWKNLQVWQLGDFIPLMETLPSNLVSVLHLSSESFKIKAQGNEVASGKLELWNDQLGVRIMEVK